jgi:hypothetical protein
MCCVHVGTWRYMAVSREPRQPRRARRPIGAARAAPPKPRISPSARAAARPAGSSRLRRRELGKARSPHERSDMQESPASARTALLSLAIGTAYAAPPKPRISPSAGAGARPAGSSRLRRRELGKPRSPHERSDMRDSPISARSALLPPAIGAAIHPLNAPPYAFRSPSDPLRSPAPRTRTPHETSPPGDPTIPKAHPNPR